MEVTQSPLVTGRSSDEGIDCMPQEDSNVAEALHAELEVEPNMNSFPIEPDPIKAPINAPNIMEEGNGIMNSILNQNPTLELFEILIKGINEGVTGFVHDNYFESRLNKEVEVNEDSPFHVQYAISAENQRARPTGTRATQKKIPPSNSKPATSSNLRTRRIIPSLNYSKSVGNTKKGRKICGKGSGDVHLELPSKHRRVSKDESDKLFSMVKVDA